LWFTQQATYDLNPHNYVIISPWKINLNKPILSPCIMPALDESGTRRSNCSLLMYCPFNYSCAEVSVEKNKVVSACIANDFQCGDEITCLHFIMGLDLILSEGVAAIEFSYTESLFWLVAGLQLIALLYFTAGGVFLFKKTNPKPKLSDNLILTPRQKFLCGWIFFGFGVVLIILPVIIQQEIVAPNFFTMVKILDAQCFNSQPDWFVNMVVIGMVHTAVICSATLGSLLFTIGLLSRGIPRVYDRVWNVHTLLLATCSLLLGSGTSALIIFATWEKVE